MSRSFRNEGRWCLHVPHSCGGWYGPKDAGHESSNSRKYGKRLTSKLRRCAAKRLLERELWEAKVNDDDA